MANLQNSPQQANTGRFAAVQAYQLFARLRLVARQNGNVDAAAYYNGQMQLVHQVIAPAY